MLTARLRARCPSAKIVGPASAQNHSLAFSKRGKDFSGKATLVAQDGLCQPGILFEVALSDLPSLDHAEGVGYERIDTFTAQISASSESLSCRTYVARTQEPGLLPFDWYLALIIAGAKEHQLQEDLIQSFRKQPYQRDPEPARPGRILALEALKAAGHADLAVWLKH